MVGLHPGADNWGASVRGFPYVDGDCAGRCEGQKQVLLRVTLSCKKRCALVGGEA